MNGNKINTESEKEAKESIEKIEVAIKATKEELSS